MPTASPEPTPEPTTEATTDPALALEAFKLTFWDSFGELFKNDLADAIESDYVFVASVDGVAYDPVKHVITLTVTSDYELLYANDHADWRDETWEFMRDYSRDVWTVVKETLGNEIAGAPIDWATWTPRLTLTGNNGRLQVSCPGSLIHLVGDREADQAAFEDECTFKYGRG